MADFTGGRLSEQQVAALEGAAENGPRSVLTFKSRRAQTLIEGQPLILLQDGKPITKNLHAERLNLDDIAEEARASGIESLDEIRWCVLEVSGSMSFIKNST